MEYKSCMFNLLKKFVLILKKVFRIRSRPRYENGLCEKIGVKITLHSEEDFTRVKPDEEEPKEVPAIEKKSQETSPLERETEIIPVPEETPSISSPMPKEEAKIDEENSSGVLSELSEEEILTTEPLQGLKEEVKIISRKPYKRKVPTGERGKKHKKISDDERRPKVSRKRKIDLGDIEKKKSRPYKQPQQLLIEKSDKTLEKREFLTRVESPYVEIELDEKKVFLIIPKQQFKTRVIDDTPQQLHYELEIDWRKQTISTTTSNDEQGIVTVEEKKIDLEQALKRFEITYPNELQSRKYSYQHTNEVMYAFIAIGNSRGRMHYLYDANGVFNPLPKREIWILLKEEFELKVQDVLEESTLWLWNTYRLYRVNLKNTKEFIIKNRKTEAEISIPCQSFSIESNAFVEDDFKEQMPLFTGNSIRIKAPRVNLQGWVIWIQNKQAGHKIITENWTGNEPLEIRLADNLPCECGEFQVDICKQGDRIPIETLFFRYVPFLRLEFLKDLIIPDSNSGHKGEIIKILWERDFQAWELKPNENIQYEHIRNGFQVRLLPEQDTFRFSVMKHDKAETKVNLRITLPRLKWRTSKQNTLSDKIVQIKRDELTSGTDFYLIVCTNDFDARYDLLAILETNGQRLQEAKFIRKGKEHNLLLNQIYDTIRENEDKVKLSIEVRKTNTTEILGQVEVLHFLGVTREKASSRAFSWRNEKPMKICEDRDIRPKVKSGKGRLREGKGFSKREVKEGGISVDYLRRFHISFDKRRKSAHSENIKKLKSLVGGK